MLQQLTAAVIRIGKIRIDKESKPIMIALSD
jgi:hypothetical protein